jgi:hypothetical protein
MGSITCASQMESLVMRVFFSPFQSIHEYHIIAAALHDMRSSPTAPAEGVKMLLKPIPQTTFFVFYGCHTLSDGSQYEGQWVRTADDICLPIRPHMTKT